MKFLLSVVVAAVTARLSYGVLWTVPDRHNPWALLAYEDRPKWVTPYKLARLADRPEACRMMLSTTPWQFGKVPDRDAGSVSCMPFTGVLAICSTRCWACSTTRRMPITSIWTADRTGHAVDGDARPLAKEGRQARPGCGA